MARNGTLILFCGKMGAGKSTAAVNINNERNGILISEDKWLASLYPDQITTFEDYIRFSGLLKPLLKTHVQNILKTGANVVMDFPANTINQRKWFVSLCVEANAKYELIYLKASNELCLKQIAQRRIEQPSRAKFDTEQVFNHVTTYFDEPDEIAAENLTVIERCE
ncbi:ATP-binding protein [Psychrosphaera sp. B3R10]|uniref:AAA family ATPase n=1 Tax=unclassified Psychrosphaera TaxID=2641570 RepID=UPI001C0887FB|nr:MULTISPECIES: ATP-binding protein [unclassified Psychrosphaera]MBU2880781.1 ATP-binding protein [Psychrosphaera sp. I2R16]MBU2991473.1 ATP-binding protein [Psychrosphaera sp. B3R10]